MRRSAATSSVISWRRSIAGLAGLGLELVDAVPLHVDDLAQPLGDVVVDAAEVVALELVLAPRAGAARASRAAGHPFALRSRNPCCSMRRRAWLRSPW